LVGKLEKLAKQLGYDLVAKVTMQSVNPGVS
jgi:hypothetical protein